MALACKLLRNSPDDNPDRVLIQVTASGNYVTTGDTLDLTLLTDPNGQGIIGPNAVLTILPEVRTRCQGYYAEFVMGTTLKNNKLQCFAPGGAEVGAGAYPAQISGGTIVVQLELDITQH